MGCRLSQNEDIYNVGYINTGGDIIYYILVGIYKYWWGYINTGGDIIYTGGDILYTGGDL